MFYTALLPSRMPSVIRVLVALCAFSIGANAGTIISTTWVPVGDDAKNVTFTLTHGAITGPAVHNPGAILSPLGFWQLTLTSIDETNLTLAPGDSVRIVGFFQHIVNPPGHADDALGVPFPFDLTATVAAPLVNRLGWRAHPGKGHRDRYSISIQATVNGNNFSGYTFVATASHVPEPTTLGLFSTGLLVLGVWRRRCFR